ncbi:unnamed protein product, partial [Arabidopsis halleri]
MVYLQILIEDLQKDNAVFILINHRSDPNTKQNRSLNHIKDTKSKEHLRNRKP